MTLIEKLEQLLTTATQTEIKSFLIDFINQEDELNISATQGLDTTAYLHYLNSLYFINLSTESDRASLCQSSWAISLLALTTV